MCGMVAVVWCGGCVVLCGVWCCVVGVVVWLVWWCGGVVVWWVGGAVLVAFEVGTCAWLCSACDSHGASLSPLASASPQNAVPAALWKCRNHTNGGRSRCSVAPPPPAPLPVAVGSWPLAPPGSAGPRRTTRVGSTDSILRRGTEAAAAPDRGGRQCWPGTGASARAGRSTVAVCTVVCTAAASPWRPANCNDASTKADVTA